MKGGSVQKKAGSQIAVTIQKVETIPAPKPNTNKAGNPAISKVINPAVSKVGPSMNKAGNFTTDNLKTDKAGNPVKKIQVSKGGEKEGPGSRFVHPSGIPFEQKSNVPEPQQFGQTAILHYMYYVDKKKKICTFYPISSVNGECRYIELKDQPKLNQQFVDGLCLLFEFCAYIVPAEKALHQLDDFKKEGKYQGILAFDSEEFRNFNKGW